MPAIPDSERVPPRILLSDGEGWAWQSRRVGECTAWARGVVWRDGRLLHAADLADELAALLNRHDGPAGCRTAAEWLADCRGHFAVVAQDPGRTLAGVDRYRTIPLFFAEKGSIQALGDRAEQVAGAVGLSDVDPWAEKEYLLCLYVLGERTLIRGVRQLEPGTSMAVLRAADGSLTTWQDHRPLYTGEEMTDWNERRVGDAYLECLDEAVQRLIEVAAGRMLALPLSGGMDSRALAVLLKRHGARNVLCFSYGRPGHHDARLSRWTADRLDWPWTFVPYTRRRWRNWFLSEERRAYTRFGANLSAPAHLQDWPAIWELRRSGRLPPEALVVPGHGWMLELNYDRRFGEDQPFGCPSESTEKGVPARYSRADLLQLMLKKHFGVWDWSADHDEVAGHLVQRLEEVVGKADSFTAKTMIDAVAAWNALERMPKLTFNSVRVYEFWGLAWALPLCDYAAADLYNRIPAFAKVRRRFYRRLLRRRLFEPLGLDRALGRISSRSVMSYAERADAWTKRRIGRSNLAYRLEYGLFGRLHDRAIHGMLPLSAYLEHARALAPWAAQNLHLSAGVHYLYQEMMQAPPSEPKAVNRSTAL